MKRRADPREEPRAPRLLRQPFYCEENVWQLCQDPALVDRKRDVVFVSNAERACPMWSQKAGRGKPIVWDYHVVLLTWDPLEIWDVDCTLGTPLPAITWLEQCFHPGVPAPYLPSFRVVEADLFTRTFASDRSHMRLPDGTFQKPPPPWPRIGASDSPSNLMSFVDVTRPFLGEVLSLAAFAARVSGSRPG
ncbi:hypothetical protein [Polyangium sorediatum]|uniref:Protein N-terminal glutamine amidohydrolase n=1 Tax=Polyangium sorediatum TaxID=889274 RepID=A0ABT6P7L9_9BACT|nr:hypothetical protein [Polyangium sorediatum]MDI1436618.1 hypothetical protein [Polyangium sorediatum]